MSSSSSSSGSSGFLAPSAPSVPSVPSVNQEEDRRNSLPSARNPRGPGGPSNTSTPAQKKTPRRKPGSKKSPGDSAKKRRYRPGTRALMEIRSVQVLLSTPLISHLFLHQEISKINKLADSQTSIFTSYSRDLRQGKRVDGDS